MRTPPTYRAAWYPAAETYVDEDDAIAAARRWLRQQNDLSGKELLVAHAKQQHRGIPSLNGLSVATPQGPVSRSGPWRVLVWHPDEITMPCAHQYAGRGALVALDSPAFPLAGWARATGAVDLSTGINSPPFGQEQTKLLQQLELNGNNGYQHPVGRDAAKRIVPDLIRQAVRPAEIIGYVTAHGQSTDSIRALQKLLHLLGHDPTAT